eukprot:snap_masked-scaffold_19-processed-gene-4.2-mRNA-1 protein AED:1.00 eAED:1.00 QI:0/0/0/0/1/1/2/0/524
MNNLYFMILAYLCILTSSEVIITFSETGETVGPFPTTRFSELMGNFSSTCQIEAQATLLLQSENPCKTSTFERDLTNLVIVTTDLQSFGCFEEVSYTNLENLGVLAILNSDPRPAGLPMYRSHFGYNKDDNSIPFIDSNFNFFNDVFTRVEESAENFIVKINNCADDNVHEMCYNFAEILFQSILLVFIIGNIYLVISSLNKIAKNEGTKPRRFILKYFLFILSFLGILALFNLTTFDGFVWITGGKYKSDLAFFLAGVQTNFLFYGTLLCAYYWTFLGNKCFLLSWKASNNILLKCFRFLSGDDFFKGIVANCLFVGNIIQTIESHFQQASPGRKKIPPKFSIFTKLTGYGLVSYIEENNLAADDTSRRTLLMAAHLSSWLQKYFLLFFLLIIAQFVLVERMMTFGVNEDSIQIRICTFVGFNPLMSSIHLLMVTCLIKGIAGPSERISTLNKEELIETTHHEKDTLLISPDYSSEFPTADQRRGSFTPDFLLPSSNISKIPSEMSFSSFPKRKTFYNPRYHV